MAPDRDDVPVPPFPWDSDNPRPAGDTEEAHDEINPRDLPKDHPGRRAAEEQAGGTSGVTSGQREGGADPGGELVDDDEREGGAKVKR